MRDERDHTGESAQVGWGVQPVLTVSLVPSPKPDAATACTLLILWAVGIM